MKRWLPLLMIGAGVLILTSTLFVFVLRPSLVGKPLPDSLAGQRLSSATYGDEALSQIAQLHGKELPIVSGAVGQYSNSRSIVLWVSESPSEAEAGELVAAMQARIAEGRSPFVDKGVNAQGNRIIYMLEGMGQLHYYFQVGTRVIWLASTPPYAEQSLQDTLAFYESKRK